MKKKIFVDTLYQLICNSNDNEKKSQLLYTIIEIKHSSGIQNYSRELYLDIKNFISFYLKSKITKKYGYDEYNIEKIQSVLYFLPLKEKNNILLYTRRLLKKEFENTDWIDDELNKCKILLYKENHDYILWFLFFSTKKLSHMCVSIFVVLILTTLFLLPAYSPYLEFYSIKYINIHPNFYVNHFCNMFSLFFNLDIGIKIVCLNCISILLYAVIKLLYIILIVNFLYNKFFSKILKNEK